MTNETPSDVPHDSRRVRVVIADRHPLVVRGLHDVLASAADFEVVGTCTDGEPAAAAVRESRPDLLIADHALPGLTGTQLARLITMEKRETKVVLVCETLTPDQSVHAYAAGVTAAVTRDVALASLLEICRRVARGEAVDHQVAQNLALGLTAATRVRARTTLTAREIEIVRLLASGATNKRIAATLAITEGTVKIHLHTIFRKAGVNNRVALTLFAQANGMT